VHDESAILIFNKNAAKKNNTGREVGMRKHLGAAFGALDMRRKRKQAAVESTQKARVGKPDYFTDEAHYAFAYALRVARIIDEDIAQLIVEAKDDGILSLNDATKALRQFSATDNSKPV